ncbi:MAG: hypothetical protein ACOZNI_10620, partial [Myxococcota bacterium]
GLWWASREPAPVEPEVPAPAPVEFAEVALPPEPATVPASAPDPVPAPRRKAAPAPVARVLADGDVTVRLVSSAGTFPPGEVPPGRYRAEVTFGGGGAVTIADVVATRGKTTRLTCDARFQMCRVE